jgi:hypothetical protein
VTTAQAAALRRGTRIVAGIGVALTVPRIVVAWLVLDTTPVPVIATALFVGGLLVLGLLLHHALLVRLGSRWWVALIGLAGTVVGGLGTSGATALSAAVAVQGYSGLVVPPQVALVNWLVTGSLTVWLLGLLLLVTTALGGLAAALGAPRRPRSR